MYCITVLCLDSFMTDYETLDVGERALFLGLAILGNSLVAICLDSIVSVSPEDGASKITIKHMH